VECVDSRVERTGEYGYMRNQTPTGNLDAEAKPQPKPSGGGALKCISEFMCLLGLSIIIFTVMALLDIGGIHMVPGNELATAAMDVFAVLLIVGGCVIAKRQS